MLCLFQKAQLLFNRIDVGSFDIVKKLLFHLIHLATEVCVCCDIQQERLKLCL